MQLILLEKTKAQTSLFQVRLPRGLSLSLSQALTLKALACYHGCPQGLGSCCGDKARANLLRAPVLIGCSKSKG